MPMIVYFRQLFEHAYWADKAFVQALQEAGRKPPARALRRLAHIAVAEDVWYNRLIGSRADTVDLWPEWPVERCAEQVEENREHYRRYLDALRDRDLFVRIAYRNTKGVAFETPVQEILTHVALHGSYHRGQIAADLREEGFTPPGTDFIVFVRSAAERG
jgi:uncharacterized damage-inducible protein DinB